MASGSIAYEADINWEPIQARGIIVKYFYIYIYILDIIIIIADLMHIHIFEWALVLLDDNVVK